MSIHHISQVGPEIGISHFLEKSNKGSDLGCIVDVDSMDKKNMVSDNLSALFS